MASKFAIIVTIKCKPGKGKDFMPIIMENAVAAMRDEPNCHEFRVMTAKDDPDTFFFYEVYTNEAALDSHRRTTDISPFKSPPTRRAFFRLRPFSRKGHAVPVGTLIAYSPMNVCTAT